MEEKKESEQKRSSLMEREEEAVLGRGSAAWQMAWRLGDQKNDIESRGVTEKDRATPIYFVA